MINSTKVDVKARLDKLTNEAVPWNRAIRNYDIFWFIVVASVLSVLLYREFHSYFVCAVGGASLYWVCRFRGWLGMQSTRATANYLDRIEEIVADVSKELEPEEPPTI